MSNYKTKAMKSLIKVSHWKERQAREVLDCWEQSGLNMRQFSREFGIGYKRLQYWRKRIQVSDSPVEFIDLLFLRLNVSRSALKKSILKVG